MPGGASLERLQVLTRPPTQAEQVELIKAVSSMRWAVLVGLPIHTGFQFVN